MQIALFVLAAIVSLGIVFSAGSKKRCSKDVLSDLNETEYLAGLQTSKSYVDGQINFQERFDVPSSVVWKKAKYHVYLLAVLATFIGVWSGSIATALILGVVILCIGYLVTQFKSRRKKERSIEKIEQLLPVVMERLVMAVQSGLDVVAALQALINIERETSLEEELDEVTELFRMVINLAESGVSFSQALRDVVEAVPCTALKHTFIHLAVAYEEGGELVAPLRELSDSTQLYYQEIVEERIARMPVKATMPLIFTFAGLIVFFITTPIIQVMSLLSDMALP